MAGISKTVISLKPGSMEEVTKLIDSTSSSVLALDGVIGFAVAVTGEDEITVIGVYQSSQNMHDANESIREIMAGLVPFAAGPPDRGLFSGVWFSS
ncbi:MAG: hypothetical protein CL886_04145 [Dehalococcoidia bacterium]|nr:hypothetical protein [Dehalococcoidia bacterium]|tara:strand:+ start:5404 stop:5691 length:288 start_codon:yes stop_codon:yes gene_type:complete